MALIAWGIFESAVIAFYCGVMCIVQPRCSRQCIGWLAVSLKDMQDCPRWNGRVPRAALHYPARRQLINRPTSPSGPQCGPGRTTRSARPPEDWGLAVQTEWTRQNLWNVCDRLEAVHGGRRACIADVELQRVHWTLPPRDFPYFPWLSLFKLNILYLYLLKHTKLLTLLWP